MIPSPFNSEGDWSRLVHAAENIDKKTYKFCKNYKKIVRKSILSVRAAMFSDSENVPLENCEGRISAQVISKCPPGIPVVVPGEVVSLDTIEVLRDMNIEFLKVVK